MTERCETCRFWRRAGWASGICFHPAVDWSDHAEADTQPTDSCKDFEVRQPKGADDE